MCWCATLNFNANNNNNVNSSAPTVVRKNGTVNTSISHQTTNVGPNCVPTLNFSARRVEGFDATQPPSSGALPALSCRDTGRQSAAACVCCLPAGTGDWLPGTSRRPAATPPPEPVDQPGTRHTQHDHRRSTGMGSAKQPLLYKAHCPPPPPHPQMRSQPFLNQCFFSLAETRKYVQMLKRARKAQCSLTKQFRRFRSQRCIRRRFDLLHQCFSSLLWGNHSEKCLERKLWLHKEAQSTAVHYRWDTLRFFNIIWFI